MTKPLIRRQIPLIGNEPEVYLKENLHWGIEVASERFLGWGEGELT
jgi:hypothetical protein